MNDKFTPNNVQFPHIFYTLRLPLDFLHLILFGTFQITLILFLCLILLQVSKIPVDNSPSDHIKSFT